MDVFHGKTALITGASSGIGEAFALRLAKSQCNLVLVARRMPLLEALKTKLEAAHPIRVTIIEQDLTLADAAKSVHTLTTHLNLKIDLLINNAGIGKQGDFLKTTFSDHQHMVQLNINALVDLTYLYTKDMASQGGGYVLLISSIVAFSPVPTYATYASTKTFSLHFGEALFYDLRQYNIHVTVSAPGGTKTNFRSALGQAVSVRKQRTYLTADAVAAQSLKGLAKRKRLVITGKLNIFLMTLLKIFPKPWHIAIVNKAASQ